MHLERHAELGIESKNIMSIATDFPLANGVGGNETIVQNPNMQWEIPTVLRDSGGRIVWKVKGNTPEQNEERGIRNVQALFLEKFPSFFELFLLGEDGKILESQRRQAEIFINDKLGSSKKIASIIGLSVTQRKAIHYFEGSYLVVIQKSFFPFGLEFQNKITTKVKKILSPNQEQEDEESLSEKIRDIEEEFSLLLLDGASFDRASLRDKNSKFERKVIVYYPGGFFALGEKFGVKISRRRRNIWLTPEGWETTKEQALNFYKKNGMLTETNLIANGESTLASRIRRYPGGFRQFKLDLELPLNRRDGYWNKDQIKIDTEDFYKKYGDISHRLMVANGFSSLSSQIINNYPGGRAQLRKELEIEQKRKDGFWTQEVIEVKALKFFQIHGDISYSLLNSNSSSDLGNQINRKYPGGMRSLKEKLRRKTEGEGQEIETVVGEGILKKYKEVLLSGEVLSFKEFLKRI